MIERIARVDPESVAGLHDRVVEDDVALAEAVELERSRMTLNITFRRK